VFSADLSASSIPQPICEASRGRSLCLAGPEMAVMTAPETEGKSETPSLVNTLEKSHSVYALGEPVQAYERLFY
jgi:hypothetical protein